MGSRSRARAWRRSCGQWQSAVRRLDGASRSVAAITLGGPGAPGGNAEVPQHDAVQEPGRDLAAQDVDRPRFRADRMAQARLWRFQYPHDRFTDLLRIARRARDVSI